MQHQTRWMEEREESGVAGGYRHLKISREERVQIIMLSRPEKRNALNSTLIAELAEALQHAENDNTCRVVVLTGEGSTFCAGADITEMKQLLSSPHEDAVAHALRLAELFKLIYTLAKPVVAAVNGPALGGGGGLACACDYVFAAQEAQFGFTEVRIGFVPAIIMFFVVQKVGMGQARKLLLGGEVLSAQEARQVGIVDRIVSDGRLLEECVSFCRQWAERASPEALARTRWLLSQIHNLGWPQVVDFMAEQNARARTTRDFQYGIERFLRRESLRW